MVKGPLRSVWIPTDSASAWARQSAICWQHPMLQRCLKNKRLQYRTGNPQQEFHLLELQHPHFRFKAQFFQPPLVLTAATIPPLQSSRAGTQGEGKFRHMQLVMPKAVPGPQASWAPRGHLHRQCWLQLPAAEPAKQSAGTQWPRVLHLQQTGS